MFEGITGFVVAFVVASAIFGALSVACGMIAGYAGHRGGGRCGAVAAKPHERAAELEKEAALAKLKLQRLTTDSGA